MPVAQAQPLVVARPAGERVIFAASLVVLWFIIREIEPGELAGAFANASRRQLGLALGFTALSYLLLTGYDALALKRLGLSIPYRTTALASFTSYSVSFTLGFPIVTGGTVRYWIYSPKGVRASEVASLTVIAGLTFWLGLGAILCACLFYATIRRHAGAHLAARGAERGCGGRARHARLSRLDRERRAHDPRQGLEPAIAGAGRHARPDVPGRLRGLRRRRRAFRAAAGRA